MPSFLYLCAQEEEKRSFGENKFSIYLFYYKEKMVSAVIRLARDNATNFEYYIIYTHVHKRTVGISIISTRRLASSCGAASKLTMTLVAVVVTIVGDRAWKNW